MRDVELDRALNVAGTRRDFQLGLKLHGSCSHGKRGANGTRRNRCNAEFFQTLKDDDDGLRGFEVKDVDGYMLFFGRFRS